MAVSAQTVEQYMDLLQRFVGLRVDLMLPEHMVHFKQQIENSRSSAGSVEDYTFLFRIFTLLAQSETPPTMSELSAYLNLPFSSTTRLIDWLVRADFVERIPDARDRRVVRVHMTSSGEQSVSNRHGLQQAADRAPVERLLGHGAGAIAAVDEQTAGCIQRRPVMRYNL